MFYFIVLRQPKNYLINKPPAQSPPTYLSSYLPQLPTIIFNEKKRLSPTFPPNPKNVYFINPLLFQ